MWFKVLYFYIKHYYVWLKYKFLHNLRRNTFEATAGLTLFMKFPMVVADKRWEHLC